MAKQEVPNGSGLEALFKQKGRAALVWYAWRASLRALPLIAKQPLRKVWSEQTVHYCYAVARVNIVLSQYGRKVSDSEIDAATRAYISTSLSSDTAAYACSASVAAGRISQNHAINTDFIDLSELNDLRSQSARISRTSSLLTRFTSRGNTAVHVSLLRANAFDFQYLLYSDDDSLEKMWVDRPLWDEDAAPPPQWEDLQSQLVEYFQDIGLGFLADDLLKLWKGDPVGDHLYNYFEDLSETITNDAEKLRQVILSEVATAENHAVRVLLVGPGGAGKSTLANLLLDKKQAPEQQATVGITLTPFAPFSEYFPDVSETDEQLEFSLWDFGGQTIFHGLHQTFMHENCVYILVVDSRHEQAPDAWLHQILGAAKKNNPKVLLVTNQYEHCYAKRNETRLLRLFPELLVTDSFYYFPCNQYSDAYHAFTKALIQSANASKKSILAPTAEVMNALRNDFEQELKLFIDKDQLKETYPNLDDDILADLVQLGHIVGSKDDDFCVNPNLVTKYGYQLLNDSSIAKSNGFVDLVTISNINFKEDPFKIRPYDRKRLVKFLLDKNLACESNGGYFFPDAATSNEPAVVNKYLNQKQTFTLLFDMDYMPHGLHTQLVNALFGNVKVGIKADKDVWRHGFILEISNPNATKVNAVVQYTFAKSMIEVTLVGSPVRKYVDIINVFDNELHKVYPSFNTYWVYGGKSRAIDVNNEFIDVLSNVDGYSELIEKAENMAKNSIHIEGDQVQFSTGDQSVFTQGSHIKQVVQRDIDMGALASIMKALNEEAKNNAQLAASVKKVESALQTPETQENNTLLVEVWNKMKSIGDIAGTIDNLAKVDEFVAKHLPAITTVLTQLV